jgi:hypothetical protein
MARRGTRMSGYLPGRRRLSATAPSPVRAPCRDDRRLMRKVQAVQDDGIFGRISGSSSRYLLRIGADLL